MRCLHVIAWHRSLAKLGSNGRAPPRAHQWWDAVLAADPPDRRGGQPQSVTSSELGSNAVRSEPLMLVKLEDHRLQLRCSLEVRC